MNDIIYEMHSSSSSGRRRKNLLRKKPLTDCTRAIPKMSDPSIKPLLEWAVTNGAHINKSIIFTKTADRGIAAFANGKIDPSEPNIKIPVKVTLNPQQAKDFFENDFTKAKDINSVTKHFLNYQRSLGTLSFWYNYINLLPEGKEIGSPLYWNAESKELLKGTNLGSSLPEYFDNFVEEWHDSLQYIPENLRDENFKTNLEFYKLYQDGGIIDQDLQQLINTYDFKNWTSFPCYLWATSIFKSRSFPYVLIDDDADAKYSMLLPLVDLLNHDPNAYVSWVMDDSKENFILNNNLSSVLKLGDEVFNNYGEKGNEELLLGYGFVIENNKNDSVALRIKVPLEVLPKIESFGIRLPRLEDYTTSKFNLKPITKDVDYNEYEKGLLYYCNNKNILPKDLLNLFGYLVKNDIEHMMSLRMRLDGLTKLTAAIELKLKSVNATIDIPPTSSSSTEELRKSSIYKNGQKDIFTKIIAELKAQEKRILKDHKSKLWDLKKILKKDQLFANSLLLTFGLIDAEAIEEAELQDQVFLLWLIRCYNRQENEEFLPKWIQTLFTEFSKKVPVTEDDKEAFQDLYDYLFPALSNKVPEIYSKGNWGVKEIVISGKLVQFISYARGSKGRFILVEPVAIAL